MTDINVTIEKSQELNVAVAAAQEINVSMQTGNDLSLYAKLLDLIDYAKLDMSNGKFTAPLEWEVDDGVNVYGIENGTWDLTPYGLGKYPTQTPRSNGALGDGMMLNEGALIVGNSVISALVGQAIGFLDDVTLASILFTANWNFDGLGNNKVTVNDDVSINGDLDFIGDLVLSSYARVFFPVNASAYFEGQNGFDSSLQNVWTGGNYDLQMIDWNGYHIGFLNSTFYTDCPTNNFDGDIITSGELMGCRQMFVGVRQGAISASAYAMAPSGTLAMSATVGFRAMRPGSITGLAANLAISAQTQQGNITIQARINDVPVVGLVVASNGTGVVHNEAVQERWTDNFNAGDLITLYIDFTTFIGTIATSILELEVVYNT